jgi:hypothetical protein
VAVTCCFGLDPTVAKEAWQVDPVDGRTVQLRVWRHELCVVDPATANEGRCERLQLDNAGQFALCQACDRAVVQDT